MGKYSGKKMICMGLLGAGLLLSFLFHQTQSESQTRLLQERASLETHLRKLKKDRAFLTEHSKKQGWLKAKSWENRVNRLIAAQFIEKGGERLSEITFTFARETIDQLQTPHLYKVTKMNIQVKAMGEHEILSFLKDLLEHFPGLLILQKLHISRVRNVEEALASDQPLLWGEFELDWISPEGSQNAR